MPRIPHALPVITGLLTLLSTAMPTAHAQPATYARPEAAVAALFPQQTFVEWTSTIGDWNGDGVPDLALLLNEVNGPSDRPMEIRLVVLAGTPGGQYTPLSASASYCRAQKFFNLEAKGASLLVTAVDKAEGDDLGSTTLQFRFNPRRGDFELIGKEAVWTSGKESGRSSVNYLSGKFITSERVKGRLKVSEPKRFAVPALAVLQGFDCDVYDDGTP
ncbi:FG-GAP repeat protein [Acidovorax sp. DW039]|uniref:hypothetical protein n=1 Tax=Acidovorax sp. DW039 TaxID=3095606 RepID=UPI0030895362|nr:FG-GAP repeat protein [Acidovorax sp. DW039]